MIRLTGTVADAVTVAYTMVGHDDHKTLTTHRLRVAGYDTKLEMCG